jgi:hypothetical protein
MDRALCLNGLVCLESLRGIKILFSRAFFVGDPFWAESVMGAHLFWVATIPGRIRHKQFDGLHLGCNHSSILQCKRIVRSLVAAVSCMDTICDFLEYDYMQTKPYKKWLQ